MTLLSTKLCRCAGTHCTERTSVQLREGWLEEEMANIGIDARSEVRSAASSPSHPYRQTAWEVRAFGRHYYPGPWPELDRDPVDHGADIYYCRAWPPLAYQA